MNQRVAPPTDLFDAALDALPVGIALFDAARRAMLINPRFVARIGLPSDQPCRGLAFSDLLAHPPDLLIPGRPLTDTVDAMLARGEFVVESHGGRLDLASRVGEGTTVEIRLPAERVLPAGQPTNPSPEQELA